MLQSYCFLLKKVMKNWSIFANVVKLKIELKKRFV